MDSALTRTESSDTEALLTDALGSTVALTDGDGLTTAEYSYDPFGTPTQAGSPSGNRTQFTGREWDGTGLQYSRARYYSPEVGRFISEDPIGFGGGDANLYSYVWNAPDQVTDPSGLCGVLDPGGCVQDAGGWWMNTGSIAVMDVLVDQIHPIAYDWIPPYGFGYAMGARKDPREIAVKGAETAAIAAGGLGGRALAGWLRSRPVVTWGHGSRKFPDAAVQPIERAIGKHAKKLWKEGARGQWWGRVVVDGVEIEYRAFQIGAKKINVGTYYEPVTKWTIR